MDEKLVYRLFREDCRGGDPEGFWDNRPRLSWAALEPGQVQERFAFGKYVQTLGCADAWYFKKLGLVRHLQLDSAADPVKGKPTDDRPQGQAVLGQQGRTAMLS